MRNSIIIIIDVSGGKEPTMKVRKSMMMMMMMITIIASMDPLWSASILILSRDFSPRLTAG